MKMSFPCSYIATTRKMQITHVTHIYALYYIYIRQ